MRTCKAMAALVAATFATAAQANSDNGNHEVLSAGIHDSGHALWGSGSLVVTATTIFIAK